MLRTKCVTASIFLCIQQRLAGIVYPLVHILLIVCNDDDFIVWDVYEFESRQPSITISVFEYSPWLTELNPVILWFDGRVVLVAVVVVVVKNSKVLTFCL